MLLKLSVVEGLLEKFFQSAPNAIIVIYTITTGSGQRPVIVSKPSQQTAPRPALVCGPHFG